MNFLGGQYDTPYTNWMQSKVEAGNKAVDLNTPQGTRTALLQMKGYTSPWQRGNVVNMSQFRNELNQYQTNPFLKQQLQDYWTGTMNPQNTMLQQPYGMAPMALLGQGNNVTDNNQLTNIINKVLSRRVV